MRTIQNIIPTIALLLALTTQSIAQVTPITLQVPDGVANQNDTIELRTTTDGTNFTTAATLAYSNKGTWTGNIALGETPFEYKYVILNRNGSEEFEGWANRKYHPLDNRESFEDVLHFMGGEKLSKDVAITIRLDLTGLTLNGEAPDQVGVMGSYGDLSWNLPDGVKHLEQIAEGIWEASVAFPSGTTTDFPIKFVWEYQGVWQWEQLAGFVDHLLVLDTKAENYVAEFTYNLETGRIQAASGTGLEVNNYALAAQRYGGSRNYEYYHAMELVDLGDYAGAKAVYARFRSHYREPFNDDFHGYLSHTLAQQGQLDQALSIVEESYNKEHDPYRKAHYRYLKGSVLLNNGRLSESRTAMREVLTLAPEYDDEAIRGHALQSIGFSYLQEDDPGEVLKARTALEQLISEHPNEQMRRVGWQYMVSAGEKGNNKALIRQAMNSLKNTGTDKQKQETRIRWVEMRLEDETLMDSTIVEDLQWLEWTTTDDPAKKERVLLLKADHQLKQGLREQAMQTLMQVEGVGKQGSNANKARIKLNELDSEWEKKRKKPVRNTTSADSTGGQQ